MPGQQDTWQAFLAQRTVVIVYIITTNKGICRLQPRVTLRYPNTVLHSYSVDSEHVLLLRGHADVVMNLFTILVSNLLFTPTLFLALWRHWNGEILWTVRCSRGISTRISWRCSPRVTSYQDWSTPLKLFMHDHFSLVILTSNCCWMCRHLCSHTSWQKRLNHQRAPPSSK